MLQKLVHLIGISGTGMGALAGLLKEKGFRVQGSDTAFYPPMGPFLKGLGIRLFEGFSEKNLDPRPDLAIIGNVVRADNPEAQKVFSLGIPYYSFPDALREFWLVDRSVIAVCGTHGKTTTSSLAVSALRYRTPGFMVGGILKDYGRGFDQGGPPWFVVEGDEYDTAFFDKTPKFLHYCPRYVILTSIEFDHADIYKDINEIKRAFSRLLEQLPGDGLVSACSDSSHVLDVVKKANCRVVTYGVGEKAQYRLVDYVVESGDTKFLVQAKGRAIEGKIRLPGRHNALNATGVLCLLLEIGLDEKEVLDGLYKCGGVKRRQEVVVEASGITLIDDFAHHPTAVKETLTALKERYKQRRLVVAFEPRTNTSRRSVFQTVYPEALSIGDLVLVRSVPDPEKAPPGDRFSSEILVEDLNAMGKSAFLFEDGDEILAYLKDELKSGDVVVVMSNGSFDGLIEKMTVFLRGKNHARFL